MSHRAIDRFLPLSSPLLLAAGFVTFALTACVTINVYFPEAKVQELSERIEDAVEQEAAQYGAPTEAEPQAQDAGDSEPEVSAIGAYPGAPHAEVTYLGATYPEDSEDPKDIAAPSLALRAAGQVLDWLARASAPRAAYAQDAEEVPAPEITNPAIRRIIESRAQRVRDINDFKARGALGESNLALLEIRELAGLELQQRAQAQRLVKAENEDRRTMFREIAAATGVDVAQLPQVQTTYAETLRRKAQPGEWIQQPDGAWVRKES